MVKIYLLQESKTKKILFRFWIMSTSVESAMEKFFVFNVCWDSKVIHEYNADFFLT